MWIKLIASLVAFGALIQSGLGCPSQCSCSGTTVRCDERSLASVPAGIPSNARELHLYRNQITRIEPGVFDSLTQLTLLGLGTNQLQSLPEGVFDRLVNLKELHLSNNQLQSLPEGVFDRVVNLWYLSLNENQLTTVPRGAFDNLKSLTHIYLFNNPWDCECSNILYLRDWIVQHASIVNTGGHGGVDNVKCSGTNKPVRSITAAASDLKYCGPATTKPTTTTPTTTTPTTTTPEMTPTTRPVPTTTTKAVPFNCSAIEQRSNVGGDCGKPACHTLMNCANFLSCLCASCALCKKR